MIDMATPPLLERRGYEHELSIGPTPICVNTREVWDGIIGESTIRNVMHTLRIDRLEAMKVMTREVILLLIAALAVSCSNGPITPQPIRDPDGLVQALRDAGASIEQVSQADLIVDLPRPQFYQLDGALVQIGTAAPEVSDLDALASSDADLRIWFGRGWYLAYDGREGGVILLLSGLLGDPVQATPIALEEPFPPAIPRAMRRLAEDRGVSPSELTVLDFQPAIWPNSCLGIEVQATACAQDEVSGWVLTLLLDGTKYQLHCDEAGENVRWDDPVSGGEE